ncbi:MAG: hypothetical protein AB7K52_13590 [Phycisphaerales bacterium]
MSDPRRAPPLQPDLPTAPESLAPTEPVRTSEARVYALPGLPLLIPLLLDQRVDPALVPYPRADDGTPCEASLWRVGVLRDSSGPASPLAQWFSASQSAPGLGVWGASEDSDAARLIPIGAWVLQVELAPATAGPARPSALRVGDLLIPLYWVDVPRDPGRDALRAAAARQWRGVGANPASVEPFLAPLLDSPLSRWRALLVREALSGPGAGASDAIAPLPLSGAGRVRVDDRRARVLDLLAERALARWETALARLRAADEAIAARLADRLLMSVRDVSGGRGVVAPAWPHESAELDRLLDALLDPEARARDLLASASAFLSVQARGASWVVDDAGQVEALSGETIATIAIANLSESPELSWARRDDFARPSRLADQLDTAPPRSIIRTAALCGERPPEGAPPGITLLAHGAVEQRLGVLAHPLPVFPPGLTIGPLSCDWSADTLFGAGLAPASAPVPRPADSPAALRLLASRRPDGTLAWSIFVEWFERSEPVSDAAADLPAAAASVPAGFIRLWFGPFGNPDLVYRLDPTGDVHDQTALARAGVLSNGRANLGTPLARVPVALSVEAPAGGMWRRCSVPIPDELAARSSVLRLSVERVDALGQRSAWPRAMLPWQIEPGRASVDLSGW